MNAMNEMWNEMNECDECNEWDMWILAVNVMQCMLWICCYGMRWVCMDATHVVSRMRICHVMHATNMWRGMTMITCCIQ